MISRVQTPNPDAYVFQVKETLIPSGTFEFFQGSDLGSSPLAQCILAFEGVELLMIAPRFITVRKFPDADWSPLLDEVQNAFEEFLNRGEMVVIDSVTQESEEARSEVEQRILKVLQEEVRPAIAQDGGDFIYHGFANGVVSLELIGACGTCPSSTATLHGGIQSLLQEEIPEVERVEQVFSEM